MKQIFLILFILSALNASTQNDLFVSSGVTLKIDGTTTVTLDNTKLTNNGTVEATAGGTLRIKGTATTANSSIAGTGTTTLANLTIDKSSNDAQIDQNLIVSGDLTMASGNLKLNAGTITFTGTGQIVGEADNKRIYGLGGELITTVTLNAPTNVNPANIGANITSTVNLGSTTVKRGHTVYTVEGSSVARYYDINPTTNTGLNATLKFYYHDSELNGNAEANLNLWRSTNAGVNWTDRSKTTVNTTDNFITLNQVNAFSRWTAAVTNVICDCDPTCSPIPTAADTYTATRSKVAGLYTHYCDGNNLLLSVLTPTNSTVVPFAAVKIKVGATAATYYPANCGGTTPTNACFMDVVGGGVLINRFWHIDSTLVTGLTVTTARPLQITSYFTHTEYQALNTLMTSNSITPLSSPNGLRLYQPLRGRNFGLFPDPSTIKPNTAAREFTNTLTLPLGTILWYYKLPYTGIHSAEFLVPSLQNSGGIGAKF